MGRTISLRGAAANAFVEAMRGTALVTDGEHAMRVATFIHAEMKAGNTGGATNLVLSVASKGVRDVSEALGRPVALQVKRTALIPTMHCLRIDGSGCEARVSTVDVVSGFAYGEFCSICKRPIIHGNPEDQDAASSDKGPQAGGPPSIIPWNAVTPLGRLILHALKRNCEPYSVDRTKQHITLALRRLHKDGFVTVDEYKQWFITEHGRKAVP